MGKTFSSERNDWLILKEKPAKISLEVACENVNALNLYKSCGFAEVTSYDYYGIALK